MSFIQNPTTSFINPATSYAEDMQAVQKSRKQRADKIARRNATLRGVASGIDMFTNILGAASPAINNQSVATKSINGAYDMAADAAMMANPIAGVAMKGAGAVSDLLTAAGVGTDQVSDLDKVLDSKFMKLTPIGLINSIGAKKTDNFSTDKNTLATVGGDYGNELSKVKKAEESKNKKIGLFSWNTLNRMNSVIDTAKQSQKKMKDISDAMTDQKNAVYAMSDIKSHNYGIQLQGGYNKKLKFEQGGEIENIDEEVQFTPEIIDYINPIILAKGGKVKQDTSNIESNSKKSNSEKDTTSEDNKPKELATDKNLIPEGALHKNKHNIEDVDECTKKGIPVIGDNQKQQAEIEKEEIIFNKEATENLEAFYELYFDKDVSDKEKTEIAISTGKLLVQEILFNTEDRAGLIKTLQKGGTLPNKPEYSEWIKTANPDFLDDNYDLELAFKSLPFEQLEKWRIATSQKDVKDDNSWHLPSVLQTSENRIIFLKKGKTTKDNPELQGEFDYYNSDKEFNKSWKLKWDSNDNRWTYIRRTQVSTK